ncbi:uncharacterized protein LOC124913015 [Impatiens glandulifera]|uniref:uncharacterized protein LOC124913015 n=1 Tax=Impatiens glandulifera TaxID=253017 RepID=UPI001FB18F89|nr:uncharacterized protein LOC124913015 [Impatiens glandulifera]
MTTETPASNMRMPVPANHLDKLEKFDGSNFKRWQQKMFFYLTTLSLARFLTEDPPTPKIDEPNVASSSDANVHPKVDVQAASAIDAWHHSDFLCRNYVLNGLSDSLYNVYSEKNTAKELWQSLERKYKQKMRVQKVYGRSIFGLQNVAAIIEKLPPSWTDFKNYLKHKAKGDERRRMEESLRSSRQVFHCNGMGHRSSECKKPRRVREANLTQGLSGHDLCAMISEVKEKCVKVVFKERLPLTNVLYVPEIRKNLISGSLLSKHGVRILSQV